MGIRSIVRDALAYFTLLDGIFRRFVWSRVHFAEDEMRFLNQIDNDIVDVAVDVGAALGAYSWIMNRKSRKVYAFEPGSLHNKYLNRVTFCTNIEVINSAVGSTISRVKLHTPGSDTIARHSATVSTENPVIIENDVCVNEVDQVTLDSFLAKALGPKNTLDLLKIDVEGYEIEVLRGSTKSLSKYHPLIICEIEARHNAEYCRVFSLLKSLGYGCYISKRGIFEAFTNERIEDIQNKQDLTERLSGKYVTGSHNYINNFVFQHPESKIKVSK